MDLSVLTYAAYAVVSVPVTVWVARTLSRHGRLFLVDVFGGDQTLAAAVNHLLVVGFYLLNLGFVALNLRMRDPVGSGAEAVEALSVKLGTVLLVLGVMHLVNVYVLNRFRRRAVERERSLPPVPPQGWTLPATGV